MSTPTCDETVRSKPPVSISCGAATWTPTAWTAEVSLASIPAKISMKSGVSAGTCATDPVPQSSGGAGVMDGGRGVWTRGDAAVAVVGSPLCLATGGVSVRVGPA